MKQWLIILLLFFSSITNAQKKEIEQLISNLNWNTIYLNCEYNLKVKIDSTGEQLIQKGKIIAPDLIKALDDPNKIMAVHVILSKIYAPEKAKLSYMEISDCDPSVGVRLILAGFYWDFLGDSPNGVTESDQNEKIKIFWKSAVKSPENITFEDASKLYERLKLKDKQQFPCNQ